VAPVWAEGGVGWFVWGGLRVLWWWWGGGGFQRWQEGAAVHTEGRKKGGIVGARMKAKTRLRNEKKHEWGGGGGGGGWGGAFQQNSPQVGH